MPRAESASASQRQRKRLAEIMDAAAKVFAKRGYHGASTQDIADVLGIRQASLYYYFGSKDAALEAVCADGLADYAKRAQKISMSAESAADKVARLVFHHLAPYAERHEYTLVFLRERRFLPAPARKRIRLLELKYERLIQRIIQQGIDDGEFRADLDPRMASLALLGLGNSAAAWFGREPGATLERITHNYVDLLIRAFRKGAPPVFRITH